MTNDTINPRDGEGINSNNLFNYLNQLLPNIKAPLTIRQFPGGVSNLTYLITSGEQYFILRRPPHGTKAKTAHDMAREYKVLNKLNPAFPYCPKPYLYCDDNAVIGAPFYLMQQLDGMILRKNLPMNFPISPEQANQLCHKFIELLVKLHQVNYKAIGLSDFGIPEGYVKRQVTGWNKRFIQAHTEDVPTCHNIMQWLDDHALHNMDQGCLIHNDYKFDNIILNPTNPTQIIGILDWEMSTLGHPLMDLGCSLAYWIEASDPADMQLIRRMPTHLPGMLSRQQLVDLYAVISGIQINDFTFFYVFGLFRLAVIAQQIYYRFYHGQTKDQRFAEFGRIVTILANVADSAIIQHSE